MYFGDIGPDASTLRNYFDKSGVPVPEDVNIAEWMLDAIGAGLRPRLGFRDWGEIWRESEELAQVKKEIIDIKANIISNIDQEPQKEYATPLWHQTKHVVWRQSVSFWRTPAYGITRWLNHVTIATVAGLIFIKLDNSRASLQGAIFLIFQFTVLPAIILAQVQPKYAIARAISFREQAAKSYKTIPFALSMALAELPYSLLCAVSFFLPIYYIPGLNSAPSRAGYQFLMTVVNELFSVALGQLVASLTPSPKISSLLNPPIMITFALFAGVTIPKPQLPKFWRSWLFELDPFSRIIGGALVTELHGRDVKCTPAELNAFTAPSNVSCGEYMQPFFDRGGAGYIVDNITQTCQYCAYKVGDQFYQPLGYGFEHRWRDLGILSAYIGSSMIIMFIAVRFIFLTDNQCLMNPRLDI